MQIVFKVNVVTETFPLDDISDASGLCIIFQIYDSYKLNLSSLILT
jgi:hypothetical protein